MPEATGSEAALTPSAASGAEGGEGAEKARARPAGRRRLGPSTIVMLALVGAALVYALVRDPDLVRRGLASTGRLVENVWLELALGFLLAGLIDAAIPRETLSAWLGGGQLARGLALGSLAGLLFPGGPYLAFPVAAGLLRSGAGAGPVIAFVTAKSLLGLTRTLAWEAPLLGWRLTLARVLPALLVPPLLGLVGHGAMAFFAPPAAAPAERADEESPPADGAPAERGR